MRRFVLFTLIFTTLAFGQKLGQNTVAVFEGKDRLSLKYFQDIRKRLKNDITGRALPEKNFNFHVLRIIAENYILWQEAKKQGFHHRKKFKQRFLTAIQGFFAEYVASRLIEQGVLTKQERFNRVKINKYLVREYGVQVNPTGLAGETGREIFKDSRKSPELEMFKPLPKAEYTPYSRFNKKAAEKVWAIKYRRRGETKKRELNYRTILDRMPDYDFYKFRSAPPLVRNDILLGMIAGDLIPLEFKHQSKNDPNIKEYIRRIEQVTLARFYRLVRGLDVSSNYVLLAREKSLEPVSITTKEMKAYYNKNTKDFKRPRTADVYMVRYPRAEIDEGDILIETLKLEGDRYTEVRKENLAIRRQQGQVRLELKRSRERLRSATKKKQKKKIAALKKRVQKLEAKDKEISANVDASDKKLEKTADNVAKDKLAKFKQAIGQLNAKENRRNGKVKRSGPLGKVAFSATKKMKRYENIAFTVPTDEIKCNQSILFNSGEKDYVVLMVCNNDRKPARFEDPMVQRRIRKALEVEKRRQLVKKLIRSRMKKVLSKKRINRKLLRSLK